MSSDTQRVPSEDDKFLALHAMSRIMIELGISPSPDYGLLEHDACWLLFAHSSGRIALSPELLDGVIRASRPGPRPSKELQREIQATAREHYKKLQLVFEGLRDSGRGLK